MTQTKNKASPRAGATMMPPATKMTPTIPPIVTHKGSVLTCVKSPAPLLRVNQARMAKIRLIEIEMEAANQGLLRLRAMTELIGGCKDTLAPMAMAAAI